MGVATGDVGATKSSPMHHAHFMTFLCVKITIVYVISTHKT